VGDHWSLGCTLSSLADLWARRGESAWARALLEEARNNFRAIGDRLSYAVATADLALLDHRDGNDQQARARFADALFTFRDLELYRLSWECVGNLGAIAIAAQALDPGLGLLAAAVAHVGQQRSFGQAVNAEADAEWER